MNTLHGPRLVKHLRDSLSKSKDLGRYRFTTYAEEVGMSQFSLSRHLRDCGTCWNDELRRERSIRLTEALEDSPTCTTEFLRELCGFSCRAAFTRFFKQTMGMVISEWRVSRGTHEAASE